jgi:hypothetical protein
MKSEDIKFLKELQQELKTQETDYQASPRFWVVRQEVREYGLEDGYTDGFEIYNSDDCEVVLDPGDIEEIKEWMLENFDNEFNEEDFEYINDFEEAIELLNDKGYDKYRLVGYRTVHKIVENTFFLTKEECKRHIESNHYHYNKPHTYAMTAWRSPQVERLWSILENADWSGFKNEN